MLWSTVSSGLIVGGDALSEGDGQGDCHEFCQALVSHCRADLGCEVVSNTAAVRLITTADGGTVIGVEDARGVTHDIGADGLVVVCAGAASSSLTQTAGLYLPVIAMRGCSFTVPPRTVTLSANARAGVDEATVPTSSSSTLASVGGQDSDTINSGLTEKRSLSGADASTPHASHSSEDSALRPPYVVFKGYGLYTTTMRDGRLRFVCYADMSPKATWAERGGEVDGIQSNEHPPPLHRRLEALVVECVPAIDEMVDMSRAVRWTGSRSITPDCQPLVGLTVS